MHCNRNSYDLYLIAIYNYSCWGDEDKQSYRALVEALVRFRKNGPLQYYED